jgi:hypothetical protein
LATPEKIAATPSPAKTDAPALNNVEVPALSKVEAPKQLAPPTIAPPVTPPTPKPGTTPIAESPPDSNDPQTDLKTAIPNLAHLYKSLDWPSLYQTYTPPDKIDPQEMQTLQLSKEKLAAAGIIDDEYWDNFSQSFEALAYQNPTYNDAGDEATYEWTLNLVDAAPYHEITTFVKINGKWYLKQDPWK